MHIREANKNNLEEIVHIHQLAFPDFFMTSLGTSFLKHYYYILSNHSGNILLVAYENNDIVGFIAGILNPVSFYQTISSNKILLGMAILKHLMLRPWLWHGLPWKRIFTSLGHAKSMADQLSRRSTVELASLGVRPEFTESGIGKALAFAFLDASRRLGAESVYLTTDANGNDGVNKFYQKLDFTLSKTIEKSPGRFMNVYMYRL